MSQNYIYPLVLFNGSGEVKIPSGAGAMVYVDFKGGDSQSEDCDFESQCWILD